MTPIYQNRLEKNKFLLEHDDDAVGNSSFKFSYKLQKNIFSGCNVH